jgi:hypothetical protein
MQIKLKFDSRLANRWAERFSKQRINHAARVLAPTLLALSLTTVAHAQGTMDFSGAQTLMGTFKTTVLSSIREEQNRAAMPSKDSHPNLGQRPSSAKPESAQPPSRASSPEAAKARSRAILPANISICSTSRVSPARSRCGPSSIRSSRGIVFL